MDLLTAKRCTPVEFQFYQKAYLIKNEDKMRHIAFQAWMNQSVKATKKSGKSYKSIYKSFDDFYDSDKALNSILNKGKPPKKDKEIFSLADKNRLLNKQRKEGKDG